MVKLTASIFGNAGIIVLMTGLLWSELAALEEVTTSDVLKNGIKSNYHEWKEFLSEYSFSARIMDGEELLKNMGIEGNGGVPIRVQDAGIWITSGDIVPDRKSRFILGEGRSKNGFPLIYKASFFVDVGGALYEINFSNNSLIRRDDRLFYRVLVRLPDGAEKGGDLKLGHLEMIPGMFSAK